MTTEAETGGTRPQATDGSQPLGAGRDTEGRGAQPCSRLDVELPAFCCILTALSHQVRGRVLQQPQETNMGVSGREAG